MLSVPRSSMSSGNLQAVHCGLPVTCESAHSELNTQGTSIQLVERNIRCIIYFVSTVAVNDSFDQVVILDSVPT